MDATGRPKPATLRVSAAPRTSSHSARLSVLVTRMFRATCDREARRDALDFMGKKQRSYETKMLDVVYWPKSTLASRFHVYICTHIESNCVVSSGTGLELCST